MPGLSPTMRFSNFYAGEARRATLWGALVRLRLPSASQIKESINEFLNKTEKFKLAKVEKLNIINLRPSNPAIIDTIIEYGEKCLAKDDVKGIDEVQGLVDLVLEVLPPPSPRSEDEMQGQEEMPTEKAMDED